MRILVVDDDQAIAELIGRFLVHEGFEVLLAFDALQAMAILDDEPLGAVITDLMMPYIDGRALIRRIRSDPRNSAIPVILITAFYDDALVDGVMRDGASLFLPKPVDLRMLAALLKFAR